MIGNCPCTMLHLLDTEAWSMPHTSDSHILMCQHHDHLIKVVPEAGLMLYSTQQEAS